MTICMEPPTGTLRSADCGSETEYFFQRETLRFSSERMGTIDLQTAGKPFLTGLCQGCPFLSGVGFRPQSRLGRVSKDRSVESDDLMSWDVRPGLFRDVVPL